MLKVMFNCKTCGKEKVEAFVRGRKEGEDIGAYIHSIALDLKDIHSLESPGCKGTHIDIMLPLGNPKGIGYED